MGYEPVHRYVAGKADWAAAGGEREGRLSEAPFVGDLAQRDVPTCRPGERLHAIRERVARAGWDRCVVITADRVVLGLLAGQRLQADGELTADLAMDPGPSTFRVSLGAREMAQYMRDKSVEHVLVTTADGVLVGSLDHRTVEDALGGEPPEPG